MVNNNLLYKIGHAVGMYHKGLSEAFSTSGVRPSIDDPTAWNLSQFWGEAYGHGKPKNKEDFIKAFQSWVFICAKLNASNVASVPLRLYVTKGAGEKGRKFKSISTKPIERKEREWLYSNRNLRKYLRKSEEVEEVTEHVLLDLLDNINTFNNGFDFMELTSIYLDLTGESYWYLSDRVAGVPQKVFTIPSQFIKPNYGDSLDNLIESYTYKRGHNEVVIPKEDVIFFVYPNPNNPYSGFSCVRGVASAVYIGSEMDAFETALFENRARPGGILETTEIISDLDKNRLVETFKQKFQGSKKAGKTILLPRGAKYTRDTLTPEEMSYIEGRKLNREEICLAFDIPPSVFFSESSNRSTSEVGDLRHLRNGILPRLRRIESKLNEKLVPLYDNRLFLAYDNPVPEDTELELKRQGEQIKSGVSTINEERSLEGKEPVEGGDEPLVDSRLVPLTSLGTGGVPELPGVDELAQLAWEKIREKLA